MPNEHPTSGWDRAKRIGVIGGAALIGAGLGLKIHKHGWGGVENAARRALPRIKRVQKIVGTAGAVAGALTGRQIMAAQASRPRFVIEGTVEPDDEGRLKPRGRVAVEKELSRLMPRVVYALACGRGLGARRGPLTMLQGLRPGMIELGEGRSRNGAGQFAPEDGGVPSPHAVRAAYGPGAVGQNAAGMRGVASLGGIAAPRGGVKALAGKLLRKVRL